jgi:hypothetical protein
MSLCWFIHEHLPKPGNEKEFYQLYGERSDLYGKDRMNDAEKARLVEVDARLAEVGVEAPIPKKWKRGGEPGFMGNDLARCDLFFGNRWVSGAVYRDQTPRTSQEFADDLREELVEWKADNPGWSTSKYSNHKEEIKVVQYAIRFLERWAKRGYCIHASY